MYQIVCYNINVFYRAYYENYNNSNTFAGLVGKVRRRKEGRVEKKRAQRVRRTQGSNPGLPRARRVSPAARQGGCLDKQAFPCL